MFVQYTYAGDGVQGEVVRVSLLGKQGVSCMATDGGVLDGGRSKAEKRLAESERALAEASLDARRLTRPDAD